MVGKQAGPPINLLIRASYLRAAKQCRTIGEVAAMLGISYERSRQLAKDH